MLQLLIVNIKGDAYSNLTPAYILSNIRHDYGLLSKANKSVEILGPVCLKYVQVYHWCKKHLHVGPMHKSHLHVKNITLVSLYILLHQLK